MFTIVAFRGHIVKRFWLKNEEQAVKLIDEGFTIYRTGTDQLALPSSMGGVVWMDVKTEDLEEAS